jgi:hypothetical protein
MYFHNGNNQSATIFEKSDCKFEEIYVAELKEGSYLVSEIPYFFSSSNGHMPISIQMRTFNHYDSNHTLIETINLTFITECEVIENSNTEEERKSEIPYFGLIQLILLFSILFAYIHKRRKKHVENRLYR